MSGACFGHTCPHERLLVCSIFFSRMLCNRPPLDAHIRVFLGWTGGKRVAVSTTFFFPSQSCPFAVCVHRASLHSFCECMPFGRGFVLFLSPKKTPKTLWLMSIKQDHPLSSWLGENWSWFATRTARDFQTANFYWTSGNCMDFFTNRGALSVVVGPLVFFSRFCFLTAQSFKAVSALFCFRSVLLFRGMKKIR